MQDIKTGIISVDSHKSNQFIDITDKINRVLMEECAICNIFLLHTTAALATIDVDLGAEKDFAASLDKLVPNIEYKHAYDPEHMPAHILATIIGTSLSLPVRNGTLLLGDWQKVVLVELNGPRVRKIAVTGLS